MAIDFNIISDRGLVVVRYSGHITIDEMMLSTKAYLAHPDYCAGQKQLVDMTLTEGFEKDYVRFMQMQAAKANRFSNAGVQSLVVYIAPTPVSREFSNMVLRSWDHVDAVVAMVQESEADALALLGQPEKTIADLLATLVK